MIAVLLPIGAMVFYPSVFGSVGHEGSGGGGVFLIMLLSVLVAFAIGSIAGAVVGVIKARTQNPKPRANAAEREAAPDHGASNDVGN